MAIWTLDGSRHLKPKPIKSSKHAAIVLFYIVEFYLRYVDMISTDDTPNTVLERSSYC